MLKSDEEKTGAVGPSSRGRRSHLRARKRFPLSMGYNGVISRWCGTHHRGRYSNRAPLTRVYMHLAHRRALASGQQREPASRWSIYSSRWPNSRRAMQPARHGMLPMAQLLSWISWHKRARLHALRLLRATLIRDGRNFMFIEAWLIWPVRDLFPHTSGISWAV